VKRGIFSSNDVKLPRTDRRPRQRKGAVSSHVVDGGGDWYGSIGYPKIITSARAKRRHASVRSFARNHHHRCRVVRIARCSARWLPSCDRTLGGSCSVFSPEPLSRERHSLRRSTTERVFRYLRLLPRVPEGVDTKHYSPWSDRKANVVSGRSPPHRMASIRQREPRISEFLRRGHDFLTPSHTISSHRRDILVHGFMSSPKALCTANRTSDCGIDVGWPP